MKETSSLIITATYKKDHFKNSKYLEFTRVVVKNVKNIYFLFDIIFHLFFCLKKKVIYSAKYYYGKEIGADLINSSFIIVS